MTDDTTKRDEDEDLTPDAPLGSDASPDEVAETEEFLLEGKESVNEGDEADSDANIAETEEAEAAAVEEEFFDVSEDLFDEEAAAAQREQAMAEAQHAGLKARASWSLVHKELLLLLLANCLFFGGVLAAWSRAAPGQVGDPSTYINGLDTIRGALIFVLAIYGFWTLALSLWFRQVVVWPFLINALLALWVGIAGFTRTIGSDSWDQACTYLDHMPSRSFLDKGMIPLSSIPPGYWLLTVGGALVLIVLLKGVISGASASKKPVAAPAGRSRRRR